MLIWINALNLPFFALITLKRNMRIPKDLNGFEYMSKIKIQSTTKIIYMQKGNDNGIVVMNPCWQNNCLLFSLILDIQLQNYFLFTFVSSFK